MESEELINTFQPKPKECFKKLSKNVFSYLLMFTSYGDFPRYIIINKTFLENIRAFIKIKVFIHDNS
jgi:hypothetical protein